MMLWLEQRVTLQKNCNGSTISAIPTTQLVVVKAGLDWRLLLQVTLEFARLSVAGITALFASVSITGQP